MKLDSLLATVFCILFWAGIGWWIYNAKFAVDYKIYGFGNVKLGEKTSGFTRHTDFMSFDKFGCKVTAKSAKCYSVYYMYEDSDYPSQKEPPDINKIISALKDKYKSGGDYSSNPSPLYLLHGRWQDFCDSDYFSGKSEDIEWFTVYSLDDHDRTINLCVSGDPRFDVKNGGKNRSYDLWEDVRRKKAVKDDSNKFKPYDPSRPIPKKCRVLLFAYDWKLHNKNEEETADRIKDGL